MPYLISHGFHCTFQPLIPQLLQSPSQGAIQPSPGGLSSSSRPPPRGLALYYVHQFSGFGLVLHPVFSFWACPSLPIIQILHHKCSSTWAGKDSLCEQEREERRDGGNTHSSFRLHMTDDDKK